VSTEQLGLFDAAPEPLNEHQRGWWKFRDDNPRVWALFLGFAQQLVSRGRRFGVKFLAERVRWEVLTTWEPDDQGYKLNNNWTAYIARDLIAQMPAAGELIELRAVREGPLEDDD